MLKLTAKEAQELSLNKITAEEARNIAQKVLEPSLSSIYDKINALAKNGEFSLHYYFIKECCGLIPEIVKNLQNNGFFVEVVYNYKVSSTRIYNFLFISW